MNSLRNERRSFAVRLWTTKRFPQIYQNFRIYRCVWFAEQVQYGKFVGTYRFLIRYVRATPHGIPDGPAKRSSSERDAALVSPSVQDPIFSSAANQVNSSRVREHQRFQAILRRTGQC
jgi:hypothetical protein